MKRLNSHKGVESPVGVTICNKAYRSRAEIAAGQFVKCTGCPAVIIKEQGFPEFGRLASRYILRKISPKGLPFVVKFFLFNLVDADEIAYFHADLLFLRPDDAWWLLKPGRPRQWGRFRGSLSGS